jgi:V/A-type H+-transporting ATPase subunit K
MGIALALLGVAFAVALSGIGSALGISYAARTAAGSLAEDPKRFGKFLLLIALPGTQGIYGFLIGFLIILRLNIMGATNLSEIYDISLAQGLMYTFAGLPVGIAGLVSGIFQGKVCASGIAMVSKQAKETGKAMVMAVFVEFYAILGLLASLFFVLKNVK